MSKYLKDCLTSKQRRDNVFPFLWIRDENEGEIAREIDAIFADGCREFCVESRPCSYFCEERWWEVFGFILDYAKSKGMRVWLLDDKHFPTGYANGYISSHPELRMKTIRIEYRDYIGPTRHTSLLAAEIETDYEERIIAVSAWKRGKDFYTVKGKPVNLTDKLDENGIIDWAVPEGLWRVYYVIESVGASSRKNYIDMLSPESCKAMLEAVYKPHYEHFSQYFGNTFRGFFSDEPAFSNGNGSYHDTLGTEDLDMPWRDDLHYCIGDALNKDPDEILCRLPALWHSLPDYSGALRCEYMERITKLYSENFCFMLGDWCREHGVEYIGHVIEDMNTHQRLGFGAGHYFRSLAGQNMSGIDIVLNQMVPFNRDGTHTAPVCGKIIDPAFFNFALAKLGASGAHINPLAKNRAMCEVFGAFGWAEGVGYMKYIADHMLSCGINQFVPHAYSIPFPDDDCPPHFHAQGKNPQEPAFAKLIEYMQKTAHMLSDGIHKADVAVFYNAQAEWTGGKMELFEKTCRRLTLNQIDFDILPEDTLFSANVKGSRLCVNGESYGALIVPYSACLPEDILEIFARLHADGLPVVFERGLPEYTADKKPAKGILGDMTAVKEKDLTDYIRRNGWYHVKSLSRCEGLRCYRVDRGNETVYSLFNESGKDFDCLIEFENADENSVFYDVWNNRIYKPQIDGNCVRVKLFAAQALLLVCAGDESLSAECASEFYNTGISDFDYGTRKLEIIRPVWSISLKDVDGAEFDFYGLTKNLCRFNTRENMPDFCGTIRYEAEFDASGSEVQMDLGIVGEIANVNLNGVDCGTQVTYPYIFDISRAVVQGMNKLTVEVVNNPVYRVKDYFSSFVPLPPSGLLGDVKIG